MKLNWKISGRTKVEAVLAMVAVCIVYLLMRHQTSASMERQINTPELTNAVALQRSFVQVAKEAEPAVVNVVVELPQPSGRNEGLWGDPFGRQGNRRFPRRYGDPNSAAEGNKAQGSGFIFDTQGHILTNHHVVAETSKGATVKVTLLDGRTLPAEVIGSDALLDIAVLKTEATEKLPTVKLANSDSIQVGEWAIAIGNPFGLDHTMTVGVISAKGRELDLLGGTMSAQDFIQTDAAINPGNSGGPLVNIYGEVVGINNAIYSTSGGNNGIGFAIPINNVKQAANEIIATGHVSHGWLGVSVVDTAILNDQWRSRIKLPSGIEGVVISGVAPGSPAQQAGLQRGDTITRFGNSKIANSNALLRTVSSAKVGSRIDAKILREGREMSVSITIGQVPVTTMEQ